jgi:hypothetical protein
MKIICFLFLSFISFQNVFAVEIYGVPSDTLKAVTTDDNYMIYAKNYSNEWKLLYSSNFIFNEDSSISATQLNDLLGVFFNCEENSIELCSIVFNRKTNQTTAIYNDLQDFNSTKQVGFFYDKQENLITIKPLFVPCKKPLTYKLKIYPDSILGQYTTFRKNGDLRVDYAEPKNGDDATIIYHIDYPKLFADCKSL